MSLFGLSARDMRYGYRAKRAGARYPHRIIKHARRADIPLSWAFALVEQESGFRNVFGCDHGSVLCHQKVTRDRVQFLIRWVARGGISNGVGLTQLTSIDLIDAAERIGGADRVDNQLAVGFAYFAGLTDHGKAMDNAWRYNGDRSYQAEIEAKQKRWHRILTEDK